VGPGLATIIGNFQVFFLAAFGIAILKEKVDWRYLVSIPLAVLGLFMIVGIDWSALDTGYKLGVLFGVATAVTYASYLLVLQRSQVREPRLTATANLCVVSLVTAAIMAVEGHLQGESFHIPDLQSWSSLLSYGVICQALGWITISRALVKVEASRAGLILLLQPTLAFVWDVVFFARPTDVIDVAGAVLALVAIYLGGSRRR
jgi:drug/metabolite transporter (DMT)-like permease